MVTDAFKGEDLNSYVPLFRQYDIPVLFNFRAEDMQWVPYTPKARMHVLDTIFPEGIAIPDYFFGKNIVHLPTVKCHIYTTTTGAMKNAFGGLLNTKRHYTHSWIHRTLVDLLAIQKEIHAGHLRHDGRDHGGERSRAPDDVPGGEGLHPGQRGPGGDRRGGGEDDGFRPDVASSTSAVAHQDGLGTGDPREIEIVGADISGESWGFHVGNNGVSLFGNLAWFGPLKGMQKLFFRTPLVHLFIFGRRRITTTTAGR